MAALLVINSSVNTGVPNEANYRPVPFMSNRVKVLLMYHLVQ